jgi:hypothetical protein
VLCISARAPAPSGDRKTLLQAFQQGIDPLKKKPEKAFPPDPAEKIDLGGVNGC